MRVVWLVAVLAALMKVGSVASQGATPSATGTPAAAYPVTPDPSECVVEPRPVEFYDSLPATPAPSESFDYVRMVDLIGLYDNAPRASASTFVAVAALAREFVACLNAGDFARAMALGSAESHRAALSGGGDDFLATVRAGVAAPPQPLPPQRWLALFGVLEVRDVRQGRLVAAIDFGPASASPETGDVWGTWWILSWEDGRVRIDAICARYDVIGA